jgi:hypothetical protein
MPCADELFNPLAPFSHLSFCCCGFFVATIRRLRVCCYQVLLYLCLHLQSLDPVQSTVPRQESVILPPVLHGF